MATNSMYDALMLRGSGEIFDHHSHAMSIGHSGKANRVRALVLPIFLGANGVSVPISRGRPPGLPIQA